MARNSFELRPVYSVGLMMDLRLESLLEKISADYDSADKTTRFSFGI